MKPNWTITNRRTENITFTRMLEPAPCNRSEEAGTYPYEILTITLPAFVRQGFVSEEIMPRTLDVVEIGGRFFGVGRSETGNGLGSKTWLSVSLPPELDPTPAPREWDVYASPLGKIYGVDCGNPHNRPVFKVREVRP